jgi:two-component system OmpR family response regulator
LNDEQKAAMSGDDKRWSIRALIVDDDVPIRELMIDYLARFNIHASGVTDGAAMRLAMQAEHFDVVVLDLMLPGEDGLSLCRWLRAESDIPILMLTARCEPTDRIIGLELGADDYMAKPFEPRELVARIQTILRRVTTAPNSGPISASTTGAEQRAAPADGRRWPGGAAVQCRIPPAVGVHRTPAPGAQPRTTAGCRPGPFDRSLRSQHRLAGLAPAPKTGRRPKGPQLIKTVRGEGYLFDARDIG